MPQYLLLAPSFTNVLNVYAFCNLHDVSWGTKGSDKAEALPSVSSKKTKDAEVVVEDTTRNKEDLDATFKETVTRALTKLETKEEIEKPTMDDENKTFRTRLVSLWMLSNAALAVAIESLDGISTGSEQIDEAKLQKKQNIYFSVLLYSTFGLSLVKFIGVSVFGHARLVYAGLSDTLFSVPLLLVQAEPLPLLPQELSQSLCRPRAVVADLCYRCWVVVVVVVSLLLPFSRSTPVPGPPWTLSRAEARPTDSCSLSPITLQHAI